MASLNFDDVSRGTDKKDHIDTILLLNSWYGEEEGPLHLCYIGLKKESEKEGIIANKTFFKINIYSVGRYNWEYGYVDFDGYSRYIQVWMWSVWTLYIQVCQIIGNATNSKIVILLIMQAYLPYNG